MRSILRNPWLLTILLAGCAGPEPGGEPPADGNSPSGAFFLPTGEPDNTAAPVIEVDAAGGIHAVYPAFAGGGAYYAYCASDCRGPDDVKVVRLETEGTTANVMLALDAEGTPHVLLSAYASVYYAACEGDCTQASSWTTTRILDHAGDREVTGEAFALDGAGRPRFLMHTYVAYLGIGQKPPETHYVTCDGDCGAASSWTAHKIADQIWRSSSLRIDATGRPRVATVAMVVADDQSTQNIGAYVACDGDCTLADSWVGQGLAPAFYSDLEAVAMKPAVSLALTRDGAPRVVLMSQDDFSQRNISYWACDEGCAASPWRGTILSDGNGLGAGLDLALDGADRPRFAYTFDYNILLARCDDADCASPDAAWGVKKVEAGAEMPPDTIFLYPNCVVSAWFLHSPSLALTTRGEPRVGYQARDISGGFQNPDPHNTPDCVAGTDMTWSRVALLTTAE